jgi:hypothetical protein
LCSGLKEAPVRYTKKIELCCLCRSSGDRTNSCRVAKEGRCRKRQYLYCCTSKASKLGHTFRRCTSTEVQLLTRGLRLCVWGGGQRGRYYRYNHNTAVICFSLWLTFVSHQPPDCDCICRIHPSQPCTYEHQQGTIEDIRFPTCL